MRDGVNTFSWWMVTDIEYLSTKYNSSSNMDGVKILFLFLLFALIKAIVPRYRYDQLMRLGWKVFLPFSLVYLVMTASFLFYFDKLPKVNI